MRIPAATYRFQFSKDFTLRDALGIVDYLKKLGISDLYASPLLKARQGSTHGYDVTDPTKLDPEIGTEEDFNRLSGALREKGMGLLLDIVPNHMAASDENPWWKDVQEKGDKSPYALFFDTDWLSHHGRDSTELGHRRFFDIGEMVGLREEYPPAFDAYHGLVFRFVSEGRVTGLRLDHIDGLYRPARYLEILQEKLSEASGGPDFYVLVEKILSGDEMLPEHWPVSGTTGYEFAGALDAFFLDAGGKDIIKRTWLADTGMTASFPDFVYRKKLQVMSEVFQAEVRALAHWLARLHGSLPVEDAEKAVTVLTAAMPVYRTYIMETPLKDRDKRCLDEAFRQARTRNEAPAVALDYLEKVLRLDFPPGFDEKQKFTWQDFVMRWQQVTGAIMAKGYEDTALYGYNCLVALNEVGGEPDSPGLTVPEFHDWNRRRLETMPLTMNASSTHDTKRSEDVRARLLVLSEVPGDWTQRLEQWRRWNSRKKASVGDLAVPDANTEILLYQSVIGAWPLDPALEPGFPQRLKDYMLKAVREAKEHTSWINMNKEYEESLVAFIDAILEASPDNQFLSDMRAFLGDIAFCGALNSLAQVLLKVASPGVPDFYRGQELWDFSLVDPDNRRPVDFRRRLEVLKGLDENPPPVYDMLTEWKDGRIKFHVTRRALQFRNTHHRLFERGEYLPLEISGVHRDDICAFARRLEGEWAIVVVPRFFRKLGIRDRLPLLAETWLDDHVLLPAGAPGSWMNVLAASHAEATGGSLPLSSLFREIPLALLGPVS